MKTINPYLKSVLLSLVLLTQVLTSFTQNPEYSFTATPTLLSGTDKAAGAVYRFSAVAPGTDAIITISSVVNAALSALDRPASAGGGYDAAFQPNVTVNKMTTGYIEFNIDFVNTGTLVPVAQSHVAATAIDVDGYNYAANQKLFEFEQFDMGVNPSVDYYFNGTDIAISYIGNAVRGTNVGGVDYGSLNTSQNVRFTVSKSSVSTIKVRSGAINGDQFNNVTRQRSFYFAHFNYTNGPAVLSANNLLSFSGKTVSNMVGLNWQLTKGHDISKVEVERGDKNGSFEKIGERTVVGGTDFNFDDKTTSQANQYYRLKLYESNGKFFYSKVLNMTTQAVAQSSLAVYPTVISGQATLSVTAARSYKGTVSITDMNGRVLNQQDISVQKGTMVTSLEQVAGLKAGHYIVVLNSGTEKVAQRIIVAGN